MAAASLVGFFRRLIDMSLMRSAGRAQSALTGSSRITPKFVLLTSGGKQSQLLAELLRNRGCRFEVVLARPGPPKLPSQNLVQHWNTAVLSRLKSNLFIRALAHKPMPAFVKRPVNGGFLNSAKLIRTLTQLAPDYILLMNVGIVTSQVILTARIGVLNAHPGLLPWVRGVDAVASSLLEGVATGATVHFVDSGIDTGPILSRFLLPVEPNDALEDLKDRANILGVLGLFDAVQRSQDGERLESQAQSQHFGLHKRLNRDGLNKASSLVADGRALELYEQWKIEHSELVDGASLLSKYGWLVATTESGWNPLLSFNLSRPRETF